MAEQNPDDPKDPKKHPQFDDLEKTGKEPRGVEYGPHLPENDNIQQPAGESDNDDESSDEQSSVSSSELFGGAQSEPSDHENDSPPEHKFLRKSSGVEGPKPLKKIKLGPRPGTSKTISPDRVRKEKEAAEEAKKKADTEPEVPDEPREDYDIVLGANYYPSPDYPMVDSDHDSLVDPQADAEEEPLP